jgi:hypothetical protein
MGIRLMKVFTRSLVGVVVVVFLASAPAVFASNSKFHCEGDTCDCSGDKDCNAMFSSGVCGDLLQYCTKDTEGRVFCECLKRQLPPHASTSRNRLAFIVLAVDQQAGKATVQATPKSAGVRIPLPAALLRHVKAGDTVFVSEISPLLRNGQLIGEAASTKKTPEECEKCRSDCFNKVAGKYHVKIQNGKRQGDKGWEDALRGCMSDSGCVTGKDCP